MFKKIKLDVDLDIGSDDIFQIIQVIKPQPNLSESILYSNITENKLSFCGHEPYVSTDDGDVNFKPYEIEFDITEQSMFGFQVKNYTGHVGRIQSLEEAISVPIIARDDEFFVYTGSYENFDLKKTWNKIHQKHTWETNPYVVILNYKHL